MRFFFFFKMLSLGSLRPKISTAKRCATQIEKAWQNDCQKQVMRKAGDQQGTPVIKSQLSQFLRHLCLKEVYPSWYAPYFPKIRTLDFPGTCKIQTSSGQKGTCVGFKGNDKWYFSGNPQNATTGNNQTQGHSLSKKPASLELVVLDW